MSGEDPEASDSPAGRGPKGSRRETPEGSGPPRARGRPTDPKKEEKKKGPTYRYVFDLPPSVKFMLPFYKCTEAGFSSVAGGGAAKQSRRKCRRRGPTRVRR